MKRMLLVVGAFAALVVPATASAAPSERGECRQAANAFLVALSEEGTRGDYMSDGLFGNEPNIENGHVVPSLTPGPQTMGGTFFTGGDLQQVIRAACNA